MGNRMRIFVWHYDGFNLCWEDESGEYITGLTFYTLEDARWAMYVFKNFIFELGDDKYFEYLEKQKILEPA